MANIQFLRGTATQNNAYTGEEGALTVDLTNYRLRLHDGVTAGGYAVAKLDDIPNVPVQSVAGKTGAVTLVKSDITDFSDADYIAATAKGAANGVASLDSAGLVPTSQLPSFVDDVVEYADLASFPATGEQGKIYVALDTNVIYRWSGSQYIVISSAGLADEAVKLATPRNIALIGDATGNVDFDGSADVSITVAVQDDSHNHTIANVDGLQAALDNKLNSSTYTASDVLTKLLTVDGPSSGLNSDLLDGQQGSYYLDYNNLTNKPTLYTTASFNVDFASKDTDDLSEGTVNLYHTAARAVSAVETNGLDFGTL